MSDFLQPGKKEASQAQASQEALLAKQQETEKLRLAEAESEVAKRRALTQRPGGRSLLVATSPQGVPNLGGAASA